MLNKADKNDAISRGKRSLQDMLRKLRPYMPPKHEEEPEPPREWRSSKSEPIKSGRTGAIHCESI
jgi:hypothetical protein